MNTLNDRLRRFFIKLTHWEYWPFSVVYGPLYLYWMVLALRSRSFFFFSASNPGIRNSGFLMESKKEIYDIIPQEYYPRTILMQPGQDIDQYQLDEAGLKFPMIAKPDIGMRGMQVKLLENMQSLKTYVTNSSVPFLVQNYIAYPNEVGIFYHRFPGQDIGHITGIVGKEFLSVRGDGKSTVEQLLRKTDRGFLQLDVLRLTQPHELNEVLEMNQEKIIVPYGNHARGAKFIDLTHLADEVLQETINKICSSIPGFYYGRLDLKFDNWASLKKGERFAIIEVNGAGSDPTHMYDPKHSLFFAWKEIVRHWHILRQISHANKKREGMPFMTTSEGLEMFRENKKQVAILSSTR
jgi:RimK-like ATP-grasp domain